VTIRLAREGNAREMARQLIQDYGITAWPLIPEEIAAKERLPIEVLPNFPANTYGALYKNDDGFKIILSAECHTDGQRRFTLCHELAHYFLDGHVDVLFGGSEVHMSDTSHFRGNKHWYEVEADAFAAELLVPMRTARNVIAKAGTGLAAVRAVEGTFATSLVCAGVRYANLTYDHASVILSRGKVIEWASCSASVQQHVWSRARKKGDWAPPRSMTYALARSPERVKAGEEGSSEGTLAEWFDGAPNVPVSEEVVGLGPYGRVLTVLTCATLPSADAFHAARERDASRTRDWRDAMRPWGWDRTDDSEDE
jgi:hypothetical protein